MFRFFKNNTFFDRTFISILLGILLIVIVIITIYPNRKVANVKMAALKNTALTYNEDVLEKINKGDSVIILGQDIKNGTMGMMFWVETKSGQRGFVPQEAFDESGVVYKVKEVQKNDELNIQKGDTVTIMGRTDEIAFVDFNIKTKDGKTGTVGHDGIISVTGKKLAKYNLNDRRAFYMTKQKFERLYMGRTFDEVENLYCNAFIIMNKGKNKEAVYPLRVFNKSDGKFYKPTLVFEDSIAKSYSMETVHYHKKSWFPKNYLFLKYLPLSGTILDIDLFANMINGLMFESEIVDDFTDTPIRKTLGIIMAIFVGLGALLWIFSTNLAIPLLLFGLLKFRYPLLFVSNKAFPITFLVVSIITTYIWIVLGLSYQFFWWFFIPVVLYLFFFSYRQINDFFDEFPYNRCPDCKHLYTINYNAKNLIKKYEEWRPKTERGKLLDSHTERWQTGDKVTTYDQYSDGSRRNYQTKIENIQNHSRTINVYQYNEYNVLYKVYEYEHVYKCTKCGYEQYSHSEELEELDRKFVKSYAK